ncbi:MAG: FAD-dependent oxidoreductase, partial [Clostridiales bacterium]
MEKYDIIIIGAGAAGVFASYELSRLDNHAKVLMLDKGVPLEQRICPVKAGKTKNCIKCNPCHIMNGYGGAGTLSDGKYNITTNFGGDFHAYVGVDLAMELMEYVDSVLCSLGGVDAKLYSTGGGSLKTECLRHNLHLLDAKVRHLGTDRNMEILRHIFDYTKDRIDIRLRTTVTEITPLPGGGFTILTDQGEEYGCQDLLLACGRSGSRWMSDICHKMDIPMMSNRV